MEVYEFECFLQQYEKDIYSFCYHLTMNKDTADDLYQDTVLQAFEFIDRIDITGNPKSFLFSIAVGKWRNEQRKMKHRNQIAPIQLFDEFLENITSGENNIDSYVEKKELNECIRNAFSKMKDKYRVPMILYYLDENSIDAISNICSIPNGTVKSRLHKGRELMKKALLKEGHFNE